MDEPAKTGILILFSERELCLLVESLEQMVCDSTEDEIIRSRLLTRILVAMG